MRIEIPSTSPRIREAFEQLLTHHNNIHSQQHVWGWYVPVMLAHLGLSAWGMMSIPYGFFPVLAQLIVVQLVVVPWFVLQAMRPIPMNHPLKQTILEKIAWVREHHLHHPVLEQAEELLQHASLGSVRFWARWQDLLGRIQTLRQLHPDPLERP